MGGQAARASRLSRHAYRPLRRCRRIARCFPADRLFPRSPRVRTARRAPTCCAVRLRNCARAASGHAIGRSIGTRGLAFTIVRSAREKRMNDQVTGSCLCGAVRFRIHGAFEHFFSATARDAGREAARPMRRTCSVRLQRWNGCAARTTSGISSFREQGIRSASVGSADRHFRWTARMAAS